MVVHVAFASRRQCLTPDPLLGRVDATVRVRPSGVVPLGASLGGSLPLAIGLRGTVLVGAAGVLLAFLWVALSPVRALRSLPAAPGRPASDGTEAGASREHRS
ncbi:MAG: hypothetical protein ACRDJN_06755 [Chloroflexota bacterium]